jgi:hypothetical protein
MKQRPPREPHVDFDFAAVEGELASADETSAIATAARHYIASVIEARKSPRQFLNWTRTLIADAYMLGELPGLTQQAIGEILGFAPGAARQGFQSLLKRRAAVLGLRPLGPGRKRSQKRCGG